MEKSIGAAICVRKLTRIYSPKTSPRLVAGVKYIPIEPATIMVWSMAYEGPLSNLAVSGAAKAAPIMAANVPAVRN